MSKFYDIQAVAQDPKKAIVKVFGRIGETWYSEENSAQGFSDRLEALGDVTEIEVQINSMGGNFFDGLAIHSILKNHPARVVTRNLGLVASASTYIYLAGDVRIMSKNQFFMIHKASSYAEGNADELRDRAGVLDSIDASQSGIYQDATGLSGEEVAELMTKPSYLRGQEALDWGFATQLDEELAIAADFGDVSALSDVPDELLTIADSKKKDEGSGAELDQAPGSNTEASAKKLFQPMANALGLSVEDVMAKFKPPRKEEDGVGDYHAEIVEQCTALGVPQLAATLIRSKTTPDQLVARIKLAAEIKDLCAAAECTAREVAGYIISGISTDDVRAILIDAKAGAGGEIDSKPNGGITFGDDSNAQTAIDESWTAAIQKTGGKIKS